MWVWDGSVPVNLPFYLLYFRWFSPSWMTAAAAFALLPGTFACIFIFFEPFQCVESPFRKLRKPAYNSSWMESLFINSWVVNLGQEGFRKPIHHKQCLAEVWGTSSHFIPQESKPHPSCRKSWLLLQLCTLSLHNCFSPRLTETLLCFDKIYFSASNSSSSTFVLLMECLWC